MKIIERYILRNFLFPFLYCLCLFLFLYIIFDLFGNLDNIFKRHIPITLLFNYYLSFIPIIFMQVSPVAVLLSTLYTIGEMNRHHEISTLKACGISTWRLLSPLLFLGVSLSILTFLIGEKIIPSSYLIYQQIKREHLESPKGTDGSSAHIKRNVCLIGYRNRLCYANGLDQQRSILFDLTILEQDNQNRLKHKITARQARWVQNKWLGSDVVWLNYDEGKLSGEPIILNQAELPMEEGPQEFLESELQSEFMSLSQLKNHLKKFSTTTNNNIARNILVGLHYKFSFPLTNVIAVLLAAPFALVTRRGGVWRGVGVSLVIGFSYYVVSSLSIACGREGYLSPLVSAWLPLILFGGTGTILLIFKG